MIVEEIMGFTPAPIAEVAVVYPAVLVETVIVERKLPRLLAKLVELMMRVTISAEAAELVVEVVVFRL